MGSSMSLKVVVPRECSRARGKENTHKSASMRAEEELGPKHSPLSAAINNTPEMLLAHVAPEVIESPPALTLSARVANADAPFTETASTLDTILHDHGAAERRAKECSGYGNIWLALNMLKSTCGGCALGREELERWVLD
jgi:hypothetical protein